MHFVRGSRELVNDGLYALAGVLPRGTCVDRRIATITERIYGTTLHIASKPKDLTFSLFELHDCVPSLKMSSTKTSA